MPAHKEHALQVRGLVRQQIDSFNDFLERSLPAIVMAPGNRRLVCDADPEWFLQYTAVRVGKPTVAVQYVDTTLTPHECRLRDMTYSAPITVRVGTTWYAIWQCVPARLAACAACWLLRPLGRKVSEMG